MTLTIRSLFSATVITWSLHLARNVDAFTSPGSIRRYQIIPSFPPSLTSVHPNVKTLNLSKYECQLFPCNTQSLRIRLLTFIGRVKRVIAVLCITVALLKPSACVATKATTPTGRVCEIRTKQQKVSMLSDISTVVVAAVMGTVLGKQIIVKKKQPNEDQEDIIEITKNNDMIETTYYKTNGSIVDAIASPPTKADLDEFQIKRRIAADRRVRELLATNNAKSSGKVGTRVNTRFDDSNKPSPTAPMSGWAGYKDERWGGYLDSLNSKGNRNQLAGTVPVTSNSYLDGLSKSQFGSTPNNDSEVNSMHENEFSALKVEESINGSNTNVPVNTQLENTTGDSDTMGVSNTQQQVIEYLEEPKTARLEHKVADPPASLSAKYAAIPDVGLRAFNILLDLGLVQKTPDINDPSYDSSADDELAPEQIFQ